MVQQTTQSSVDTSSLVVPVRLRGGVVALESSFRGGLKREVLRSLCQVCASYTRTSMKVKGRHTFL